VATRDDFSAAALALLQQAGWCEGREFDPSTWEAKLREEDFDVSAPAHDFLAEFGGLKVAHPNGKGRDFAFDLEGLIGFDTDALYEYSRFLGADLCPIGRSHGDYMLLGMAPDGRVFAGVDQTLVQVGDSALEAIERLVADGPFQKLR
jgi:hypothetical protein